MKALVYTGTNESEIRAVEAPVAGAGQSIVDVAFCGICGSDMHAWHGHDERRIPPLVLGHEAVGVARSGAHAGARVAINPLMSCGTCQACTSGNRHLCGSRELIGMRYPGAFAEQVMIPDANLTRLDDSLSFQDAALAEPLAVAVRTVGLAERGGAARDSRSVILGGGAIGLLCAQVMKAGGYAPPRIAETNSLRRTMLEGLGLGTTYDPREEGPEEGRVDLVIDAVGMGATRAAASMMVRPGGVIVHVGLQDNEPGLDTRRITLQEIAFLGAYCYRDEDFAEALALLTSGKVSGEGWAEIRPLDDGAEAFIDIDQGRAPPKIILSNL
ncbi:MAG: alcohol dehydrogenase catalytic domain-containing protein [Candidatus Puniceispirillaceae bacterium]